MHAGGSQQRPGPKAPLTDPNEIKHSGESGAQGQGTLRWDRQTGPEPPASSAKNTRNMARGDGRGQPRTETLPNWPGEETHLQKESDPRNANYLTGPDPPSWLCPDPRANSMSHGCTHTHTGTQRSTHTHRRAHTHPQKGTHRHAEGHTHPQRGTHRHAEGHTHPQKGTHTPTEGHTQARTRRRTHAKACTPAQATHPPAPASRPRPPVRAALLPRTLHSPRTELRGPSSSVCNPTRLRPPRAQEGGSSTARGLLNTQDRQTFSPKNTDE